MSAEHQTSITVESSRYYLGVISGMSVLSQESIADALNSVSEGDRPLAVWVTLGNWESSKHNNVENEIYRYCQEVESKKKAEPKTNSHLVFYSATQEAADCAYQSYLMKHRSHTAPYR